MPQNFWPWNNPKGFKGQPQPAAAYTTSTATSATILTAAKLTGGGGEVYLAMTGTLAAGATATTDTAANIIAAIPYAYVGQTYTLRIVNESSGAFAWTLAGGTGVTIVGTATIAQNTWREYVVTIATATTVTFQNVGTGTYS